MDVRMRARRAVKAGGTAAVAFGLLTTTMSDSASAVAARTRYASAIIQRLNIIRQTTVGTQFFGPVLQPEPDNDLLPNATPDGFGGYMFWTGTVGYGAIYSHDPAGAPSGSAPVTNPVYGNIVLSWAELGFETGKGYPVDAEHNPSFTERLVCPAGTTKVQTFRRRTESTSVRRRACFVPGGTDRWAVSWR